MTITTQINGNCGRITLDQRFDSAQYQDFKKAYLPLIESASVQTIEIDLSKVGYLDSGALGMLVLLNESAKNSRKSVTLVSIPGRVSEVLRLANADKLFSITLPTGVPLDLRAKNQI